MRLSVLMAAIWMFCFDALGDSRTLIVSGGASAESNFPSFDNIVNLAHSVERERGRRPIVMSSDGALRLSGGARALPAKSKEQIAEQLRILSKDLKGARDSLTIFIGNHGEAPRDQDPLSGGFVLYSDGGGGKWFGRPRSAPVVSYQDLGELIKKHIPSHVKVRLVGMQCYSGGLHSISFQQPNVCSSANTDWKTVARGGPDGIEGLPRFHRTFWETVKQSSSADPATLSKVHRFSFNGDLDNEKRGQISSSAFVDSVLREGAYAPQATGAPTDGAMSAVLSSELLDETALFECRDLDQVFSSIQALSSTVSKSLFFASVPDVKLEKFPPSLSSRAKEAMKDWLENRDMYYQKIRSYRDRYRTLLRKLRTPGGTEESKAVVYGQLFRELEREGTEDLNSFFNTYMALYEADKVRRFLDVASPEQLTTFNRLLKCETEPM